MSQMNELPLFFSIGLCSGYIVSSEIWDTCLIYFSLTFSLLAAIPIQFPMEQQPYNTSLLDHFAFPCESEQLSSPSLWRVCVNDVSRM